MNERERNAIEDERAHLMTVDALLHCLEAAISEGSEPGACSMVTSHTRELVARSLERLDAITFR